MHFNLDTGLEMAGEFYIPAPLSDVLNGYQVGWLQNLGAVQKIKMCLCLIFNPGCSAPTQEGRQNVSVNEERNLLEVITPHLFHTKSVYVVLTVRT